MFKQWQGSFVAESTLRNAVADKDLIVALPELKKRPVVVEKGPDGAVYFAIQDAPPIDEPLAAPPAPKHVVLYWDASGSRAGADFERQASLLKACFEQWAGSGRGKPGLIRVDLIVFRDAPAKAETFLLVGANPSQLIERLRKLEYDGGTQIGAMAPSPGAEAPDFYMLFTDGISTFGREKPEGFKAPVYAFSSAQSANHSFLHYLATTTGGRYFNLTRVKDAEAASALGATSYGFLAAEGEGIDAAATCPQSPAPLTGGRFTLVGKLTGPEGKVTIRYGRPGGKANERTFTVSAAKAAEGTLLQRFWAQKRLEELLIFQDRNREAITALGREHGLVTPFTSLIVLDSLEQYVEHQIAPPKTLPQMREEYMRRIDTVAAQAKKQEADRIQAVLALWQQRLEWWKTDFKYPKDFKYTETKRDTFRGDGGGDGSAGIFGGGGGVEAAAAPAAEPPAPAPIVREALRAEALAEAGEAPRGGLVRGAALPQPARDDMETATPARQGQPGIVIKEWDPKAPYLEKLKSAKPQAAYETYMREREALKSSPAFFLDCANFFFTSGQKDLALRVLSNIAEMELENPALLRVLGHRLAQAGELELATLVFEEVLKLRPEEPQSYRDLALVLAERQQYARAIELLNKVVMGRWDERFTEIELTALIEANALIPKAR
jgi:tetratricopeptide (TPR) repeat protein